MALCARALKRKVDGSLADGSGSMTNSSIDGNHLSGEELYGSIVEIDEEPPFQYEETLIGVRMTVPVIRLRHRADAHFVIVDPGKRMIVVAVRRR